MVEWKGVDCLQSFSQQNIRVLAGETCVSKQSLLPEYKELANLLQHILVFVLLHSKEYPQMQALAISEYAHQEWLLCPLQMAAGNKFPYQTAQDVSMQDQGLQDDLWHQLQLLTLLTSNHP
eukprot:Gb_11469 [translate_table: standard]